MMFTAAVHCVADLFAETGGTEIRCVWRKQLPVQPGRAVRPNLPFQIEGGQDADAGLPVAAGVVGGGAALEVVGDAPLAGVDPLDDAGAAQCLQPTHMSIDIALIVAARNAALELHLFQMAARPIDAILCDGRNGPVGRALRRVGRADLDDAADPRILDAGRVDAGKMMSAAVDPVHHDGQVLAQLVGQVVIPPEFKGLH